MNVLLEKNGKIAKITISREKALNALNTETLEELGKAVSDVEADESVAVVIVTGAGSKAFVAGADITEMESKTVIEAYDFARKAQRIFSQMEHGKKFYIGAINGFALGGGCELAMACDMRIASANAKFGQPEVTLGIIPGFGGTQRLVKNIGLGRAKHLIATGEFFDANEAYRLGLVSAVVESEALLEEANNIAAKIVKNSCYAVSSAKYAANAAIDLDAEKGMEYEALAFGRCFSHPDQKEGMNAFVSKRKAEFK